MEEREVERRQHINGRTRFGGGSGGLLHGLRDGLRGGGSGLWGNARGRGSKVSCLLVHDVGRQKDGIQLGLRTSLFCYQQSFLGLGMHHRLSLKRQARTSAAGSSAAGASAGASSDIVRGLTVCLDWVGGTTWRAEECVDSSQMALFAINLFFWGVSEAEIVDWLWVRWDAPLTPGCQPRHASTAE